MRPSEKLEDLLQKNHGYLLTSDVVAAGISRTCLADYVRSHALERAAHGVYMSADARPDDYYLLYLRNQKLIFSHESALFLHQMMEREPAQISATVSAGYNATHLRKKGIRVYQVRPALYDMGRVQISTNFDNQVAVYDKERTICDTVLQHDKMDAHTYQKAWREYLDSEDRDLDRLLTYARVLHIEETVRMYMEVMV